MRMILIKITGLVLLLLISNVQAQLGIEREVPLQAYAGDNVTVILKISGELAEGVILRESIPSGWSVLNSSPPGYFDPKAGIIRWVFIRGPPAEVSYTLHIPEGLEGTYRFNGSWLYLRGMGIITASEMEVLRKEPEKQNLNIEKKYVIAVALTLLSILIFKELRGIL